MNSSTLTTRRIAAAGVVAAVVVIAHPTPVPAGAAGPAATPAAASVPVSSGMGVTLNQVDYTWSSSPDTDSAAGEIRVDVATLTSSTSMSSGFLNVGTSQGWVVENLPVVPGNPDPVLTQQFEISTTDGTAVTSINADVEFSPAPMSSFSSGSMQAFAVGDTVDDDSGFGAAAASGPEAPPPPGVVAFRGRAALTVCSQTKHPNVETAVNQCAPAAVANSLDWMRTTYGLPVPDANVPGERNNTSLVGKLDLAMNRPKNTTIGAQSILDGKLRYLANSNLGGKVLVKHQGMLGGADYKAYGLTSHANGTTITAKFIQSEICAGEDVELGVLWKNGGHFIELTGAGTILGVPWITYKHDHVQGDNTKGTTGTDFSFLIDTDKDGRLNLVNEGGSPNLAFLITQSLAPQTNVPEMPATAAPLLLLGLPLLAAVRRRRVVGRGSYTRG